MLAYVHEDDRRRFAARRAGARRVLGLYTRTEPKELPLVETDNGKPFLGGHGSAPCFSVAHRGRCALIAVASVPVGVDVEEIDPGFEWSDVAARVFSPEVCAKLAGHDVRDATAAFFREWVRHEALLKAAGLGLGDNVEEPEGYSVVYVDLGHRMSAAVAARGPAREVRSLTYAPA
jgi:4'-phosphopantetheinyl transferase